LVFSNKGSEDIPNAKAMFDGREEDLLCEIDTRQDMVIKQLNRLSDKTIWQYSDGYPPRTGASNAGGVNKNHDSEPTSGCC